MDDQFEPFLTDFSTSFDLDLKFDDVFDVGGQERYHRPRHRRNLKETAIRYEYAQQAADGLGLMEDGERVFAIVSGRFIFGDLIEAYIKKHNLHVKKMTIATLSMSQENIDSLGNLLHGEWVDEINLLVSDYFYSNERWGLVPYLYKELDQCGKFQFSVAAVHTKIVCFETHCGRYFVWHGSANLRTSDNIEQMMFECSESLYRFNLEWIEPLVEKYQTIEKSMRGGKLWQAVQEASKKPLDSADTTQSGQKPKSGAMKNAQKISETSF